MKIRKQKELYNAQPSNQTLIHQITPYAESNKKSTRVIQYYRPSRRLSANSQPIARRPKNLSNFMRLKRNDPKAQEEKAHCRAQTTWLRAAQGGGGCAKGGRAATSAKLL